MSAIDKVKTLIGGRFSDGRSKLSCYVNEKNVTEMNCIRLFYTNDNDWVSAIHKNAPYYKTGIQVSVRHNDYDKARSLAFSIVEYINSHRKTEKGYWWIPRSVPLYVGVDSIGGYVWAFNLETQGGA
jgi:hypothetical protein